MRITAATLSDVEEAVDCLAGAFAQDPITGFLLQSGPAYRERLTQFFSLLMRARIALTMPVLVARGPAGIQGAAMGYATAHPAWPKDLTEEWDRFEEAIPGLGDRMASYEKIAAMGKPPAPHYHLGAIGVGRDFHGLGIGRQLLKSFCEVSADDPLSRGVYLETATAANLGFYARAGFAETLTGSLGSATLWCMYLPHGPT
jgi:GNAT superfamily N-acetyltransferase